MTPRCRGSIGGRFCGEGGAEGFGKMDSKGRGDICGCCAVDEEDDEPQTPPTGRVVGKSFEGEELRTGVPWTPKTWIGPGAVVIVICSGTREVGAGSCCKPEPELCPGVVLPPTPLPLPREGAVPAGRDLGIFLPSSSPAPVSDPATVRGDPPTIVQDGAVERAPYDATVGARGTSGGGLVANNACLAAST